MTYVEDRTDAQIRALSEAGLSDPAIAARLGVTRGTVYLRRKRLGIGKPSRWEQIDPRLRQLNADGHSFSSAGRLLGIHKSVVAARCRKLGLSEPQRPREIVPTPPRVKAPQDRHFGNPLRAGSAISWAALEAAAKWRPEP